MEPWIVAMCRKAARRQVMVWLVVLAVGLAIVAMNWRYVRNFCARPYAMDGPALSAVSDAATMPHYFVAVMAGDAVDTGVHETTTTTENGQTTGSYVSARFYAVREGDRYLIVKSATQPAGRMVGALEPIPYDLASDLFPPTLDGQTAEQHCYAFYLDAASDFREPGYIGGGVAAVLALLLWFFGRRSLGRMLHPESHPVVKRASQWGDLQLVSHQLESELNDVRLSAGSVRVTDNFAVEKTLFTFDLYRLNDLLWGYEKVTKKRVNFIPAGKSYAAVLKFYGGNLQVSASEAKVTELLKYLAGRAPWAVFGYSDQLNTLFTKQTAEFARGVEARREALAAKA